MLSDFWPHGAVAQTYGVLREDGVTERAIFIVDPQGVIQYIDIHDFDEQPDNQILFEELRKIDKTTKHKESSMEKQDVNSLPHGGVVMYCNSWCPDCFKARQWLKNHHIAFTEVDIPSTPGAEDQVREWGGGNVVTPTFEIDGEIVIDFDKERLAHVLKIMPD